MTAINRLFEADLNGSENMFSHLQVSFVSICFNSNPALLPSASLIFPHHPSSSLISMGLMGIPSHTKPTQPHPAEPGSPQQNRDKEGQQ